MPAPGAQIGGLFGLGSFYIIYNILQLYYRRVMSALNHSCNVLARRENKFSLVDKNERTQKVFVHGIGFVDSLENFTRVIVKYEDPQNACRSGMGWCSRVQCTKKLAPCFLVHCALDLLLTPLIPAFLLTLY